MANSNTEHSRKLRAKTASIAVEKKLKNNEIKKLFLTSDAATIDFIKKVISSLGVTRPQATKIICEYFFKNNSD